MSDVSNLHRARKAKNDEFYTRWDDVDRELSSYPVGAFRGKRVYCPCDNDSSAFVQWFRGNFHKLGLRSLTWTYWLSGEMVGPDRPHPLMSQFDGQTVVRTEMDGDGDFRSDECVGILRNSDLVATNPPFSLFTDFVDWLFLNPDLGFVVVGNAVEFTCEGIFPRVVRGQMWPGVSKRGMDFVLPDGSLRSVNACWYTNLEHGLRRFPIPLTRKYVPEEYPMFDTYPAIDVDRVQDIPFDYDGAMGVPVTYLFRHCPDQFELIGKLNHDRPESFDYGKSIVGGRGIYARVLIRKKRKKKNGGNAGNGDGDGDGETDGRVE